MGTIGRECHKHLQISERSAHVFSVSPHQKLNHRSQSALIQTIKKKKPLIKKNHIFLYVSDQCINPLRLLFSLSPSYRMTAQRFLPRNTNQTSEDLKLSSDSLPLTSHQLPLSIP